MEGTDEVSSPFHQMAPENREFGSRNSVQKMGRSEALIEMENVFSMQFAFK